MNEEIVVYIHNGALLVCDKKKGMLPYNVNGP